MGMFDNYDNMSNGYIPDNMHDPVEYTTLEIKTDPLVTETNLSGRENYAWNFGEVFNIEFDTKRTILVEENALVYNISGECPDERTIGVVGQKAYNTVDIKSWVLVAIRHYRYTRDNINT